MHAAAQAQGSRASLPAQLTPLIGRATELRQICRLLRGATVRLVTLTGIGGIGKTRLALATADRLDGEFRDGTVFVGLASVNDSALVGPTIAQALQVREAPGHRLGDLLVDHLRAKQLLLVLDNFEQVVPAATLVTDLLVACPAIGHASRPTPRTAARLPERRRNVARAHLHAVIGTGQAGRWRVRRVGRQ